MPSNTLSATLIDRIDRLLTDHGIVHKALVEGTPYLNLNVSDGSNVFVKVARSGERSNRGAAEVCGASWATASGLRSSRALIDHVLEVEDETGEQRAITVWAWLDRVTSPAMYDQARMAADLLVSVVNTPAPVDATTFDLSFFHNRIHDRLDGRTDPDAVKILRVADEVAEQIKPLLDTARYTWMHGDLHLDNVVWLVNGKPALLDWESHGVGPVEWDVAQLFRSVFLDFPKHAVSEKRKSVEAITRRIQDHVVIDWELVEAFGRFRAASRASHLLVHGHEPLRRMGDMSMLDTVPFHTAPIHA